MKKVLATLLAGALAIGLSGCLEEGTSNENSKAPSGRKRHHSPKRGRKKEGYGYIHCQHKNR